MSIGIIYSVFNLESMTILYIKCKLKIIITVLGIKV